MSQTTPQTARPARFSSGLGAWFTMVGVSVGLGNVWRFPYMMGQNGGSAFLLVYLACVLLLAVPALTAEWTLGRSTRQGPMGAFTQLWGSRWGRLVGYLLLITVLVADAYYIVVISQIALSAGFSISTGFDEQHWAQYQALIGSSWWQFGVSALILFASLGVIALGVRRGIERVSRWFVPLFAVIMVYLVLSSLRLDGAFGHLQRFLQPNFDAMDAGDYFAALGQAFFSLGLGGTFFVIYGSYLPAQQSLFKPALATALGDTSAALLAGLFIVPTTLVFGLDLGQGPRLIFDTLPRLFMHMPGGQWLGALFLVGLVTVAFLSNIAALAVAAAALSKNETQDQSASLRPRVFIIIAIIELALMALISYDNDWIGTFDLIFGSGMQVGGSLLAIVAVAWGFSRSHLAQQVFGHSAERGLRDRLWQLWLRWVIPGILVALLLGYVLSQIT